MRGASDRIAEEQATVEHAGIDGAIEVAMTTACAAVVYGTLVANAIIEHRRIHAGGPELTKEDIKRFSDAANSMAELVIEVLDEENAK